MDDAGQREAGDLTPGDGSDRRSVLKKIGVGAAVAWTAPVVLSSPAQAAASDPTPPAPCPLCGLDIITNSQADGPGGPPPPPSAAGWTTAGAPGSFSAVPYFDPSVTFFVPFVPTDMPNVFAVTATGPLAGGQVFTSFSIPANCRTNTSVTVRGVSLFNDVGPPIGAPVGVMVDFPGISTAVAPTAGSGIGPLLPFALGPVAIPATATTMNVGFLMPPIPPGAGRTFAFDGVHVFFDCA